MSDVSLAVISLIWPLMLIRRLSSGWPLWCTLLYGIAIGGLAAGAACWLAGAPILAPIGSAAASTLTRSMVVVATASCLTLLIVEARRIQSERVAGDSA